MGTYVGNTLVAGATFNPTLLDFKWTDHILNDVSWLRADTFSWQPGNVYIAVQDFLEENYTPQMLYCWGSANTEFVYSKKRVPEVGDILYDSTGAPMTPTRTVVQFYGENVIDYSYSDSGGTHEFMTQRYAEGNVEQLETETIAGITISYCRSANGLKIVPASQESNVQAIYNATGVAWYYILDTVNNRFKLPRTQFGFSGLRDTVGNYVPESLPDHNHTITQPVYWGSRNTYVAAHWTADDGVMGANATATSSMASASNSTYKDGAPVQQRATQMYLYFYVGNFTKSAIQQTAGITTEELNGKVDVGHQVIEFQAPTVDNNYTWYRKYADGWVEQGGHDTTTRTTSAASSADATVVFPVEFSDTNYTFNATVNGTYCGIQEKAGYTRTTTNLKVDILACYPNNTYTSKGFDWFACGMAAN